MKEESGYWKRPQLKYSRVSIDTYVENLDGLGLNTNIFKHCRLVRLDLS